MEQAARRREVALQMARNEGAVRVIGERSMRILFLVLAEEEAAT